MAHQANQISAKWETAILKSEENERAARAALKAEAAGSSLTYQGGPAAGLVSVMRAGAKFSGLIGRQFGSGHNDEEDEAAKQKKIPFRSKSPSKLKQEFQDELRLSSLSPKADAKRVKKRFPKLEPPEPPPEPEVRCCHLVLPS